MSKYFDRDFLRFFFRFATIISISLMIILAAHMYQQKSRLEPANAINALE